MTVVLFQISLDERSKSMANPDEPKYSIYSG